MLKSMLWFVFCHRNKWYSLGLKQAISVTTNTLTEKKSAVSFSYNCGFGFPDTVIEHGIAKGCTANTTQSFAADAVLFFYFEDRQRCPKLYMVDQPYHSYSIENKSQAGVN
jgi:hypothetical protein